MINIYNSINTLHKKIKYKRVRTSDNKIIHNIYNKILRVQEMGQNYSD